MKRTFTRCLAALLLLIWLPAGALALTGQTIPTFLEYYKEDISFLNETEERHMLPRDLNVLALGESGRKQYSYYDDTLHVTIAADPAGIIETCEIRLLFPKGAAEGNSLYMDFVASSYHSIAFIMAMHVSTEASSRFLLAEEIKNALEENHGAYDRQLGSYAISCVKVIGEGAVFTFTNNGLAPAETGEPAETDGGEEIPPEVEEDEAANYG
ncbi:MAG: hypothetical protein ABIG45_07195 [Bacillota bacterium]